MRQAIREISWEGYARDRRAKQVLYMEMVRELGRQFDLLGVRADCREEGQVVELIGVLLEDDDDGGGETIKLLRKDGVSVVAWMSFDDGIGFVRGH